MLTITFTKRNHTPSAPVAGVLWQVHRLEWRAVGGPWSARLSAAGDLQRLWDLAGLLRCGLRISDDQGLAWWGYLASVEIIAGERRVRVTLDGMANRVAAAFREYSPGSPAGGARRVTGFVSDAGSTGLYGEKEQVVALGQATESEALAFAAATLARSSIPQASARPAPEIAPDGAQLRAILEARGWWETLDWKYYAENRGLVADTSAGAAQPVGSPDQQRAAQAISMPAETWPVGEVWVRARRAGSPGDTLRLELCPDAAGQPGPAAAASEIGWNAVPDDWGWLRFPFAAPVLLPAGTAWLVLSRSGPLDASQHYQISADQGCNLSGGQMLLFDGSAWAPRSPAADLSTCVIGVEETTRQAARILSGGCGQFLRGARIEKDSGVSGRLFRDGSLRGRQEVEALLRRGTDAGERLLARVEPDRTARIWVAPKPSPRAPVLGLDGILRHVGGRPLAPSEQPAGQWVRLGALAALAPPGGWTGAVFVERCVWDGDRLRIEP